MVVVRKGSEKRLWVAKILLQVQLYFPQVHEKSSVGKTGGCQAKESGTEFLAARVPGEPAWVSEKGGRKDPAEVVLKAL